VPDLPASPRPWDRVLHLVRLPGGATVIGEATVRPTPEERIKAAVWFAGQGFRVCSVWSTWPDGRCRCGDPHDGVTGKKMNPDHKGKHPVTAHGFHDATTDVDTIRTLLSAGSQPNYGLVPPEGCFALDVDGAAIERLARLEVTLGPLPRTLTTRTANGTHVILRWPASVPRPGGDLFGMVTRWGGVPGTGYVIGPRSVHPSGVVYQLDGDALEIAELPEAWARAVGADTGSIKIKTGGDPSVVEVGQRHFFLRDTARRFVGTVRDPDALKAAVMAVNAKLADPKSEADVDRAIGEVLKFPADEEVPEPAEAEPSTWPVPPNDAAYHGVLGDIAHATAPFTEADPVGVLGTLLAMFGAACGGARTLYQGSLQRTNLSFLLVGETGFRGRKGTALDVARGVFGLAYPDLASLWLVGVASGEAITGHLGRHDGLEGRPFEDRVLIVETEFGRLLTIMNREGSTLSPVLRNAWDGVPLGHARARDESLVTKHHVTILGHVTPVELRAKLTETDAANGFANRLLFLAVRRSRLVPFPMAPDDHVREFVEPLHRAIIEARLPGEMSFDEDARDRWEDFYAELAVTPRLGLAGAVTGRHEAQVARLSLVYALADRSPVVGVAHLDAAIALAEYARRSATWALGDSTGNRHADVLRRMLADGELGWKEAKLALGLRTAADMSEVVAVLVDAGLAEVVRVPREGPAGRPRQVIRGRAKDAKGAKDARGART
jgi:Bifunctional DNA primase/polymerase, N-terminal/Protein of unknown function (DUF3987)